MLQITNFTNKRVRLHIIIYRLIGFFFLTFVQCYCYGQKDTSNYYDGIAALVQIDSIFISAEKSPLDIEDFIELILADTSYYRAFKNLKMQNLMIDHQINYYNKKTRKLAACKSITLQKFQDSLRSNEQIKLSTSGNFFKNQDFNYYTSKIIDEIFYTKTAIIEKESAIDFDYKTNRSIAYQINQLKKVIFKPGTQIDVPILGNKLSIFSKKMRKYYDYKLRGEHMDTDSSIYLFSITLKPKFEKSSAKTIVKSLITTFDAKSFQVLKRSYHFAHKTALYKFDFRINALLQKKENKYYPLSIYYNGYWKLLGKKIEKANFILEFELLEQ